MRLEASGITKKYVNEDLNKCILEIKKDMGIKIQDEDFYSRK